MPGTVQPFDNFLSFPGSGNVFSMDWRSASCIVSSGDTLWIGTDGGGIHEYLEHRLTRSFRDIGGKSASNHPLCAMRDSKGNIWVGAFKGGVYKMDTGRAGFRHIPVGTTDPDVRGIAQIDGSIMCLATEGIYEIDMWTGALKRVYDIPNTRAMMRDRQGRIWIGTYGEGLLICDSKMNVLRRLNVAGGFPSNSVSCIIISPSGDIWAATGEGLVKFSGGNIGRMEILTSDDGLPGNFISAIAFDDNGRLWGSTYRDIFCISSDGRVMNFSERDGVLASGFLGGSVDVADNGVISFGGITGLSRFNVKEILAASPSAAPILTEFTAFGTGSDEIRMAVFGEVCQPCDRKLPYDMNSVSFRAAVQNFAYEKVMEYEFMLKGFDKDWVWTWTNSIVYRNLPPGRYTLMVRARFHNRPWLPKMASVTFTILPPWYLTWWAKTLYFALGIALAAVILYLSARRFKAEQLYKLEKLQRVRDMEETEERLRFYTNITHELRTPLTLIAGPIEDAMKSESLSARDRDRLDIINRNARNLLGIVNQLLDFRKTETNHRRLYVKRGNIVPMLYDTVLKYKGALSGNKVKVVTDIPDEEIILPFDKEAVGTILDNLMSNALKYTDHGSVTVSCRREEVKSRPAVVISVADTGYGISPEALPHIFDRYYQEKGSHQASGTGIGLSLVRNLVNLHHAEIDVRSRTGKGTTFTLTLWTDEKYPESPTLDDSETLAAEGAGPEAPQTVREREKPLILVVEDNPDMLRYISDTFTDLYDVVKAENGKAGVDKARELMPDVIITDLMMPVMDGFELCREITGDVQTSHIPIVVLTAKDSDVDREEGYRVGAHSYLTKPFTTQLLLKRIENILHERRRLADHLRASMSTAEDAGQACEDKTEASPAGQVDGTADVQTSAEEKLRPLDREFLAKLDNTIDTNLSGENVDMAFLCDNLCMSRATLYRKIKALTGISPNEYLRKRRMAIAVELLKEQRYTIQEVAFRVGLNSVSHFRQTFKDEFGVSPSEFIKS